MGPLKKQDIPHRLKNVKGSDVYADQWFLELLVEKGALVVEYVFISEFPISPAFVEALLLQAFFNENSCLPYRNNSF